MFFIPRIGINCHYFEICKTNCLVASRFDPGRAWSWTLLVITQNYNLHKNFLGNEQWRAVDSIKHCEVTLVFEKEVISHSNIERIQTFY